MEVFSVFLGVKVTADLAAQIDAALEKRKAEGDPRSKSKSDFLRFLIEAGLFGLGDDTPAEPAPKPSPPVAPPAEKQTAPPPPPQGRDPVESEEQRQKALANVHARLAALRGAAPPDGKPTTAVPADDQPNALPPLAVPVGWGRIPADEEVKP